MARKKVKSLVTRMRSILFYDYYCRKVREPKVKGWIENEESSDDVFARMQRGGVSTKVLTVDIADYHAYFDQAGYAEGYRDYYPSNIREKSLEHYVAQKLLQLTERDVYIDVASQNSPAPEIYNRLYGCDAYAQDLSYAPGLNDRFIGGNAAAIPVEAGFATKMALHCSFEHFEGDSDIRFVRECERVLRKGGMVCILPLYLFDRYAIQTDPTLSVPGGVRFERDAILYCAKKYLNRHGRFYDPSHFQKRIDDSVQRMQMTLYRVTNSKEVCSSCYLEFALLLRRS